MAWKKKEKELTEKEALMQARIDLAPCWYRSSPLLAAVEVEGVMEVFPLEPSFSQSHWMLCFADPTTLSGQVALQLAAQWNHRYSSHSYRTVCIQEVDFPIQRERAFLEKISEEFKLIFPLALDRDHALAKGFSLKSDALGAPYPRFVFWSKGSVVWNMGLDTPFQEIEMRIQSFLRNLDHGLPLPDAWNPEVPFPREGLSVDFGKKFWNVSKELQTQLKIETIGSWQQTDECFRTQDPDAKVTFYSPDPCVAILAKSVSETIGESRLQIDVNDAAVYETLSAGELRFDDSGEGSLGIETFRLYRLVQGLPADLRKVTLRFPTAKRVPVGIFSLRFYTL